MTIRTNPSATAPVCTTTIRAPPRPAVPPCPQKTRPAAPPRAARMSLAQGGALLDKVGQPAEALAVATPLDHAAHVQLHGPDALRRGLALAGGEVVQAEGDAQLVLRRSTAQVDLVPEHQEGHVVQLLAREQRVQLFLRLVEALAIVGIDEKDDGVYLREVILPHAARDLVTTQVKGAKLDLRNG